MPTTQKPKLLKKSIKNLKLKFKNSIWGKFLKMWTLFVSFWISILVCKGIKGNVVHFPFDENSEPFLDIIKDKIF